MATTGVLRVFVREALTIWTIEALFYGCYVVLFGIGTTVFFLRRKRLSTPCQSMWCYFWAILVLFVLVTVATVSSFISGAIEIYQAFDLGGLSESMTPEDMQTLEQRLGFVLKLCYLLANIVTDFIMIHRCYIIWPRNWLRWVLPLPVVISFASNCVGLSAIIMAMALVFGNLQPNMQLSLANHAQKMLFAFMSLNVINNVLLTVLIAGRVWWIGRKIAEVCQITNGSTSTLRRRYESSVALMKVSPLPDLYAVMTQIAGIAPTLIIVRVQLGVSIDNLNHTADTRRNTINSRQTCLEIMKTTETVIDSRTHSQILHSHEEKV
ncbi:hypothetical protein K435DRAFT_839415 [Dendrothele bispora CBS 962.96]|uniref:Uncharacterized protein n=1 Tax=Dendrothele bispora (strain CBS 962.96) TaxID=1314807 RepID=A0A4S8M0J7_DENBC|nr:hypothetical protein K435DRAFT_839415 [Dendrothele bispora CBS 962.96]